jgi:predicted permease
MFGWGRRRKQLLEEMEEHIALETQENVDAGMPPKEARRAARQKFGSAEATLEASRELWGGVGFERLVLDVRYAVRSLRRIPAYTVTLVVTLALGLGSVTAMLAIVESILLKPVALPNPQELVQIYAEGGALGMTASANALSYAAIGELGREAGSFAEVGGYNTMVRPVRMKDDTRVTVLVPVTPNFLPMLGVKARLGRVLGSQEAAAQGVMVSDVFWRERMHADPGAVGATLQIAGQLRPVVGVLPPGVHVPLGTDGAFVYVPIIVKASGEDEFGIESAAVIARLKPGVTKDQALADAESVFAHAPRKPGEALRRLQIRSYRSLLVGDVQKPLLALLGGVGVLLLIACANAANLQIGRAANRVAEMSLRSALGASFPRLLQQLLTESVLLSLVGATLGGMLAFASVGWVRRAFGTDYARFDELALRPIVIVAISVLALLVGMAATVAPALTTRRQIAAQFASRTVTRRGQLPGLLVALQVALTCILLVVSGLFVRTMQSLENVKLGFDPRGVTTLVAVPANENDAPQHVRALETGLLHRFESLPGVQSVTMQSEIPFSSYNMTLDAKTDVAGRPSHPGDSALYSLVSTNFVSTSGIRLLQGRGFNQADEGSSAMVALVNEAFASKYLRGRDVVGATLRFHRNPGETDAEQPFNGPMTVVGLVENELQGGDLEASYSPMVYLDDLQLPGDSFLTHVGLLAAQYAVRSSLAPAALATEMRSTLHRDAPDMVEMNLKPMQAQIADSLGERKLALRLVAGFGLAALALSAVGIYGVLAYLVARTTRETGIRIALGSTRPKAAMLVLRQAGKMALLGLVPGLAGAWAAGYAIRSFLYGVQPLDGITLAAVGVLLMLVAACAAGVPAVRAAMVDPIVALRAE